MRVRIHAGFALLATGMAIWVVAQWMALQQSKSAAEAVRAVPAVLVQDAGLIAVPDTGAYPEARLAWANALSAGGNFDRAEAAFNELIQRDRQDSLGRAAQFNLANMYLRRAQQLDTSASRARPLLELGKQRYRDLLWLSPNDWDARYNLERALRLAPEPDGAVGDKGKPTKSVRVVVPDFKVKDLP